MSNRIRFFMSKVFRGPTGKGEIRHLLAWLFAASAMFTASLLVEPPVAIALLLTFAALYVVGWVADATNRSLLRQAEAQLRHDVKTTDEALRGELGRVDEVLRGVVEESVEGVRGELKGELGQVDQSLRGLVEKSGTQINRQVQVDRRKDLAETYGVASSIAYLTAAIGPKFPIQFGRGWPAPPEMLSHLYHLIVEEKPSVVLDIGSGLTTLICALAVEKSPGTQLVSWEHDPRFEAETRALLERFGVSGRVKLELRPLESVVVGGRDFEWYSLADQLPEQIDLLVVDGPPGSTGPRARFPALPLLLNQLAPEASIFLDDVQRPEEEEVLSEWQEIALNTMSRRFDAGKSSYAVMRFETNAGASK